MKRAFLIVAVLLFPAAVVRAEEAPKLSLGYAFLHSLETDGGNAPLGAYLSGWSSSGTALEVDLAWHRRKEGEVKLNTFTVLAGVRKPFGTRDRPYVHLLGGLRHDKVLDESVTSWGGAAGAGIDLATSGGKAGLHIRLGVDYEMFFKDGENQKALRLTAGFTF
jgi:hypothetical protein